jgi:RNA recognition motif-containing protein
LLSFTTGVAYVKYEKASAAALAVENLHEVTLNGGAGPRLKVMLAESPYAKSTPGSQSYSASHRNSSHEVVSLQSEDPDNLPPRSRLFIVVPKNARGAEIESRMAEFPGLQYCKTDLIASKGIVFAKYDASSSAYAAMEAVQASGSIAGYRVKVMIAEPKNQRKPAQVGMANTLASLGISINSQGVNGMNGANSFGGSIALGGAASQLVMGSSSISNDRRHIESAGFAEGLTNLSSGLINSSNSHNPSSVVNALANGSSQHPVDLDSVPPGNRLFVVVHKSVNEESLSSLFRCFSGMEYLNLKRDRVTGRSKGYAYVNYYTLESATLAKAQLNGIEFPQGSGCILKVLFAAPLTVSGSSRQPENLRALSVSSGNSGAEMVTAASPGKSFLNSHSSMTTPSHDTAATNFQLPSPNMSNSGSDSVGQAFGYGDFGHHTVQNSARTDLSSTSHESFVSPLSSPLGKSNLAGGADVHQLNKIQQSLVDLRLDFSLFDETDDTSHTKININSDEPPSPFGKTGSGINATTLRDSIESSFGSFTDDNSKQTSVRDVYSIFAEPPQCEKVHEMFEAYGDVENIELIGSKVARIRYQDVDAAHSAITGMNDLAGVLTVSSSPPHSV